MTRGSRVLALAAATALTVTACGESATDQTDAADQAAADPQAVTGTVTFWDTSDATSESPAYKELVTRFEEQYPNITVEYVNVPFDGADDKFKTAAQSGDGAPDVMRTDVGWTSTFAALGYLQPLDGTPALDNADDYLQVPMESNVYEGKTYGVPQVTDTLALLYNKDHFEQAGIDAPPATWDELRETASTLEEEISGTTGVFLNADSYFLLPFVYGEGADYVDTEAERITIDSPEVSAAVETVQELTADGVGTTDTSANKYTNMQDGFKDGSVSMIINGPWSVSDTLSGDAFSDAADLGVAPVPAGPQDQGGPVGGHNYTVYAGSPDLAASYLFVRFLNSAESQAHVAAENNTLPTRGSVYDNEDVAANEVIAAFEEPLTQAKPRPAAPGAGTLYDLFTPFYEQILGGQASVEDGLAQAQRKAKDAVPGFES
ncbi:extracellular solute-binding protein [Saccharomonospora piscinae]|uniref:Sugar ABC transporter substrate-binding protein n=1 Tax=Saccharomonospora piscinae TaxID=687388 RepID=A0A1V8ZXB3_SACPI|nr:extracellular solute-binding protein [Saccharomonospora piscinae]OQO89438.1 sugar ABC transporter substrate-binding protein [Saccharomonospora piscinae]TLW91128.1 extracellular solute-binding protein [Saccharomonospora piscinae]